MQERQSSNHKQASRFSGLHLVATSIAALAGVAIAGYQTIYRPSEPAVPQPVQVTVTLDPAKAAPAVTEVAKGDPSAPGLAAGAAFTAALHDGTDQRYAFAELFDGNPQTRLSIKSPDSEVNVLMSFAGGASQPVRTIQYEPPPGAEGAAATQLDVMVLPDGQMTGAGRAIQSFALQTTPGRQVFEMPGGDSGKAIWFRIAGPPDQGPISVGEFSVLN
jgi:hypothetical protein